MRAESAVPLLVLAVVTLAGACDSPAEPSEGEDPPAIRPLCGEVGTTHSGQVVEGASWTRSGSPHHLRGAVEIGGRLALEAGAVVCGAPGATLVGRVHAAGAPGDSVVFTASDPARGWGGLVLSDSSVLSHTVVELADTGIVLLPRCGENTWCHPENMSSVTDSRIRYTRGPGFIANRGSLVRVALEFVCNECGSGGVVMANGVLREVLVRGSGAAGIHTGELRLRDLTFADVRVEDSAGEGIVLTPYRAFDPQGKGGDRGAFQVAGTLHVSGSGSHAARVRGDLAGTLADALVGNGTGAPDTLLVVQPIGYGIFGTVRPDLPWRVSGSSRGTIRLGSGSYLHLEGDFRGGLVVQGSAAKPAKLHGEGEVTLDLAELVGLHVEGPGLGVQDADALVRDVRVTGSATVELAAPGLDVERLEITGAKTDGLHISAPGVTLRGCTVSGSAGSGILVSGSDVRIHRCRLERNDGPGIHAAGPLRVDARGNWWGDPRGPRGPAGDGVQGPVDVSGHLEDASQADATPGPPVRVELTPATLPLDVGEAGLFSAVARDARGLPVVEVALEWRAEDTTVAVLAEGASAGTLVGRSPGRTIVTASLQDPPSASATAEVRVDAGAHPVRWEAVPTAATGPRDALTDVWAGAPDSVFAVGPWGTGRYSGRTWSWGAGARPVRVHGGGPQVYTLGESYGTGGLGPGRLKGLVLQRLEDNRGWRTVDVFAAGADYEADLWVSETGRPFLAIDGPAAELERESWSGRTGPGCAAVSGRSETEVYIACADGVRRWDGSSWSLLDHHPDGAARLRGLWASPTRLWAVGDGGAVHEWNGSLWSAQDTPVDVALTAVHGADAGPVYAVGAHGVVLQHDGVRWKRLWAGVTSDLRAVWVVEDDVYVVGDDGVLLRGRPIR